MKTNKNGKFRLFFINKTTWVFAANSDYLILYSLQPKVVNFRYFKLRFLWYLIHSLLGNTLKGTIVNRTLPSLPGGHLKYKW